VDRYLDDSARYGGIDRVLIWYVYPTSASMNRTRPSSASDLPAVSPA